VEEQTAALRQNQDMLRAILDNAPVAISVTDLEGHYTVMNKYMRQTFGVTEAQVLNQHYRDILPPALLEPLDAAVEHVKANNVTFTQESTIELPEGARFYQTSMFPISDNSDRMVAIGAIATDITERKQREKEIRTFKAVFDNASDAISIVRPDDGTMTYYNDAHRTMYRCGDSQIGQSIGVLVAEQDQPQLPGILKQITEEGVWQGQLLHVRADGTTFTALESCFVIRDEQGTVTAMVGIVRDISDLLAVEAERTALQEQMIEAQRAALRELSTPLIPIADDVVIMPLIGTIDSQRAQQVMETLLEGVARYHAETVILDITGVQVVDTQVANTFIGAAQAVKLLGARVMMTGIQPQIAQTLVQLGVDLSNIDTRGSLQAGIVAVLSHR
jgi:anti-anti-sigma factor